MKIELIKTDSDAYYVRFKSKNGRILCHAEAYTNRRSALRSIKLIAKAASEGELVEIDREYD